MTVIEMEFSVVRPDGSRPWYRPRCESEVSDATARWRDACGRDYRCEMLAWYEVNGKRLCKRHAGHALIAMALMPSSLKDVGR